LLHPEDKNPNEVKLILLNHAIFNARYINPDKPHNTYYSKATVEWLNEPDNRELFVDQPYHVRKKIAKVSKASAEAKKMKDSKKSMK
jgi:hypothetical protein